MLEEILRAIPAFTSSMIKFIFGPLLGFGAKLHPLTTIIATVAGMMTSVISFTYFGKFLRERIFTRYFRPKKTKSQPSAEVTKRTSTSKFAQLASRYGLTGIAFFTPLILTPIGGTLLAVGIGSPREKIILYMFTSAIAWAIIFTGIIYFFGHETLPDWVK
jgi:membrane protein DedA with SNARE-associated domain